MTSVVAFDAVVLGVRVRVSVPSSEVPPVVERLGLLVDPPAATEMPAPVAVTIDISIEMSARGFVAIGTDLAAGDPGSVAIAAVTAAVVRSSPLLCVHAGVVSAGPEALVVPGPSGHGKTTLVTALLQSGFDYVSDEVLAIGGPGGRLAAFPRPLGLAADVWAVLGLDPSPPPDPGAELFLPAGELARIGSPERVGHVLLTERRAGPATITEIGPGPAVAALLRNSFNHYLDPAGSMRTIAEVCREARIWQAAYGSAPELALVMGEVCGLRPGVGVESSDRRP